MKGWIMIKKVVLFVLMLFTFTGCKTDKQNSAYWDKKETIKYWDGKSLNVFEGKQMAAMLWLRSKGSEERGDFPAKYQIYKRFDDDDYAVFLDCLRKPDDCTPFLGPL
jgi:hypothetical protein